LLADLLKGYKPPAAEAAAEEPAAQDADAEAQPPAESSEPATEESSSEFTQDLMNPEGTPLILETGLPE